MLIVDDDQANQFVLRAMLVKDGHTVLTASNGHEAIDIFRHEQPDIVLMDVMMPDMDGYEATRQIKSCAGSRFVPVLFLTALQNDADLVQCIEAGGDDFLSKPFKRNVLRAKISALERVRQLYSTLQSHSAALASHHERMQREQEVAQSVFARIAHAGCLHAPHIRYLVSPVSIFNGDVLLAAQTPSGGMHVMLGDFTGHGLPAAIGAMPVSDLFYSMTAKGYTLSDIVSEANQKLRQILPTGIFCATGLLSFDAAYRTLAVWNGGLPDVLVYRPDGWLQSLPSQHVPLGVMDSDRLDTGTTLVEVEPGARVYLFTDGVIEARNPGDEMFGQERLEACLTQPETVAGGFATILAGLTAFRGGAQQDDDLTLIEITCNATVGASAAMQSTTRGAHKPPARWRITLEFGADALRSVDPLPQLMQMLAEIQGLAAHRERLYTILAELFTNAVDHGLLGLDSALKRSPQGFVAYYTQREQRLAALNEGQIRVTLEHVPYAAGGKLTMRIADSGPGFAVPTIPSALVEITTLCGRGIPLVRSLCQELVYSERGNCVQAVYVWE
jgi:CheY-like chemotaxis protein